MVNEKLKEMIKINPQNMNKKQEKEFLNELINATLFLPIDRKTNLSNISDEINPKDLFDFSPIIIENDKKSLLPLFTDTDSAKNLGEFDFITVNSEDIQAIIVQSGEVEGVVLNPGEEYSIGMDADQFLEIVIENNFAEVKNILNDNAQILKTDSRFYLREEYPLMKEAADNGIFTSNIPFFADFIDKYPNKGKYINILLIPKGTKFLAIGQNDEVNDTLFAPTIKFKLTEQNNNIFTWQCISQDLKYKNKKKRLIILFVAMIILIVVILIFSKY